MATKNILDSDTQVVVDFYDAKTSASYLGSYHSLIIENCPTPKDALQLLKNESFLKKICGPSTENFLTFKVNQVLTQENLPNFNLNYDKNIVILIISNLMTTRSIFWKLSSMKKGQSLHMLENGMRELKEFVTDVIVESVRRNFCALSTDFPLDQGYETDIMSLADYRGFNILTLAAEAGNTKVVHQLLSIGFSVTSNIQNSPDNVFKNTNNPNGLNKSDADLAYERGHFDLLYRLLMADSLYPKGFDIKKVHLYQIQRLVKNDKKFFKDIEDENLEAIEIFLKKNPTRRYIYDVKNTSAAGRAIKFKKFKAYKVLIANNVYLSPHEDVDELKVEYLDEDLQTLKEIHETFSKENPNKHIKILSARSYIGHDDPKYLKNLEAIEEAYKYLSEIPQIKPLLQVVAEHHDSKIYFDFNRTSVNFLDPSLDKSTNGVFYANNRIYIAAKGLFDKHNRNKILAVIAHEICHHVMFFCYKNYGKPYQVGDKLESVFGVISMEYKNKKHFENIIEDVFLCYDPRHHDAELIVRAPQLFVFYNENPQKLETIKKEYSKLFEYFLKVVLVKVQETLSNIKNAIVIQEQQQSSVKNTSYVVEKSPVHVMEISIINKKKNFDVNFEMIDKIFLHREVKDRKIVIMSIIGEYRKGKSFFLDYCLRFMYAHYASLSNMDKPTEPSNWMGDENEPLSGFSWKHGIVADTKGILFWPDVFFHEDIAIILMDTQGLFEIKSTGEENSRIFGLSNLISSIQIINTQGVMREDQIEHLEMATNLTKFIAAKQLEGCKKFKPFQKLIFLIRDWTFEGIGYAGGQEYLKSFLEDKEDDEESETKAESIRKNILDSFDALKCFLLNHPGFGVFDDKYKGEWSKLDVNFVTNLKELIESILKPENLTKKSILGKEVKGLLFHRYICDYFRAFKDTKLPETENIFQMIANIQMKAIVAQELKLYISTMDDQTLDFIAPNFAELIDENHKCTKQEAVSRFLAADDLNDVALRENFKIILEDKIENYFESWRKITLRDYQMIKTIKVQMDIENSKHKDAFNNLQEVIKTQAEEHLKIKEESEAKNKELIELISHLNSQIRSMNSPPFAKNTTNPFLELGPSNLYPHGYSWVPGTTDSSAPDNAVVGGYESTGEKMFVGRVLFRDAYLPCKIILILKSAYTCYGGIEHAINAFEFLIGTGFYWIKDSNGNVPTNAVSSGITKEGESLYIGRAHHEESLTIGKIHRSHGVLYLPYNGDEIRKENYEVLCL